MAIVKTAISLIIISTLSKGREIEMMEILR